ncbi:uncharacterized protein LY79DRAFT_567003 [Colletotrichum navitas]|uniref:Uncharacterized protein n=1 Tax=Colletotrichum navitas TaxID=681940 RepID=A0AAD8PQZ0_9PEZI|nr:uncharacterized protein LY79DRAFT_567003 [Colletotrichum navitas]KAK1574058.1 hypothetical protein LY79DRAFT_567003 [Colletotrichum navitas]
MLEPQGIRKVVRRPSVWVSASPDAERECVADVDLTASAHACTNLRQMRQMRQRGGKQRE